VQSVNPATGRLIRDYPEHGPAECAAILNDVARAARDFSRTTFAQRARGMNALADLLAAEAPKHARLITTEMGKLVREAEAEVKKCAQVCAYYAANAQAMLAPAPVASNVAESRVVFEPLGTILGIMPWNFPFWQAIRFAAPAIMAGNAVVLKHAPNVCGCALAVEDLFRRAGFPENVFRALFIPVEMVETVIAHPGVRGVSLTGSVRAGRSVAALAGKHLKKSVLELGGSDPCIVLADADLAAAARTGAAARLQGCGQVCIASKRFIVERPAAGRFTELLVAAMSRYAPGDPLDPATTLGPMAREDLRRALSRQIETCLAMGARPLLGGRAVPGPGFYFEPTLLADVAPGMPAYDEELFGPAAALLVADDAEHALFLANDTPYGLGAGVWSADADKALALAGRIEAGTVTINGMTKSEPALPFGGVKNSGYGRELSEFGIREFVNIKTLRVF
jgi:succinate-semialdehyde dehydrogenase/glutarate-semialdehyde dehydrogenase